MGHSEGIMRPLMLSLGATLLVGAPALIALDPVLLPAQVQSQELKHWIAATGLDTVTLLFGLAAVLLIAAALGVVFATRARRRRERQSDEGRMAPENAHEVALAREIDQLRAQVIYLSQEGEALLLERDHLRSILARIGELIQRASEGRPGASGGAAPEVGP